MQSPRLPWEVLERVVGHSGDSRKTLRSLSLTCRQLLPRSRCLILAAGVWLRSHDHAFALVDFLENNSHLKSFITSIRVNPHYLPPFPLLHILGSNLSEITFGGHEWHPYDVPSLNPTRLTCFQRFGSNIQTLRFTWIRFSSRLVFAQLLLAFSNIVHLVCADSVYFAEEDMRNQAPLAVIKRRLYEKLRLRSLVIDTDSMCKSGISDVLFDPTFNLGLSSVESLETTDSSCVSAWPTIRLSDWALLKSLKLQYKDLNHADSNEYLTKGLNSLNSTICTDITIECGKKECPLEYEIFQKLGSSSVYASLQELDKALLKFSQVSIILWMPRLGQTQNLFWTTEFKKFFPLLSQRGDTVIVKLETVSRVGNGHANAISVFAFSPDGKWTATGSRGYTIILWNLQDGSIAQEWAFPGYQQVFALAFSHNCRYLLGGNCWSTLVVWDLQDINHIVATVTYTQSHSWVGGLSCAWSPDDTTVVMVKEQCFVKLWNPSTSESKVLDIPVNRSLDGVRFSPDGAMLVFTFFDGTVDFYRISDIIPVV